MSHKYTDELPRSLRRLVKVGNYLVRIHILFIILWVIGGVAYVPFAEAVAKLATPYYLVFSAINPNVNGLFFGALSHGFYARVASETFCDGVLIALFMVVPYVSQYASEPSGLASSIARRFGTKEISSKMILLLGMSVGLIFILGAILPVWFGFRPYPASEPIRAIQLHQLALWSIVAGISPTILIFSAFCTLSYFIWVLRYVGSKLAG